MEFGTSQDTDQTVKETKKTGSPRFSGAACFRVRLLPRIAHTDHGELQCARK